MVNIGKNIYATTNIYYTSCILDLVNILNSKTIFILTTSHIILITFYPFRAPLEATRSLLTLAKLFSVRIVSG